MLGSNQRRLSRLRPSRRRGSRTATAARPGRPAAARRPWPGLPGSRILAADAGRARNLHAQDGRAAGRAGQQHPAAGHGHPVRQAGQAATPAGVRATPAVVADLQHQDAVRRPGRSRWRWPRHTHPHHRHAHRTPSSATPARPGKPPGNRRQAQGPCTAFVGAQRRLSIRE